MAKLINVGFGNVVNSRKIVAVVSPDAAPVKRMIQSVKGTRTLIDATQGRKTKAVIVTSDDYFSCCFGLFRFRKRYCHETADGKI